MTIVNRWGSIYILGSPWNLVDPFFALDTRAFKLIGKPRIKSGPSFSANGALSLNPGQRPGSLESNKRRAA